MEGLAIESPSGWEGAQNATEKRESEQEVIQLAQGGNSRAFEILFLTYQKRVYKICLKFLKDPEESRDITQEIFLKVYRSLSKYEPRYGFYSWLYRVSSNCCIDYLRKKKRKHSLGELPSISWMKEPLKLEIPDDTFNPEKIYNTEQGFFYIRQALEKMPAKMRSMLVLKAFEGWSHGEIARILGCPEGTVKSGLRRARAKFAAFLTPTLRRKYSKI